MNRIRKLTLLVSLPLVLAHSSCAHYDPKRPNFKKNEKVTEPTFDSDKKTAVNSSKQSIAGTSNRAANPMTGPGMEATVPTPIVGDSVAEEKPKEEAKEEPKEEAKEKPKEEVVKEAPPPTYNDALAAIDKAKQKDQNLQKYFVGAGYDLLKGERMSVCLDPGALRTLVTDSAEVTDNYSISHDYRDLYNKLETEFGADIGGIWQIFSGKLSFKTKIANENRVATDDVIVIASFTQLRNKITLLTPATEYSPFFRSTAIRDKEQFRRYCGDKFTKEVSLGASMHLVFTAKKTDTTTRNSTEVNTAIEAGLKGILSFGTSVGVSKEQKEILKGFSFSVKCYTLGANPGVCGDEGIASTFDINGDMTNFQKKVENIRKNMVQEVKEGKNLVVVRETMAEYEIPSPKDENDDELANVKRWEFFVDYRDRVAKMKRMSLDFTEAEDICTQATFWQKRCSRVKDLLKSAIEECTSLGSNCEIPNDNEFQTILTARGPGWVRMYKDSQFNGTPWTLDFRDLAKSSFQPNKFYGFKENGLGSADNKVSSVESRLKRGWRVILYQDAKPSSPGLFLEFSENQENRNVGNKYKDMFSAFKLEPIADLGD